MGLKRGDVLARAIALVPGESVVGIALVQRNQVAVPRDLGQDAGGGDAQAGAVAPHDRLLGYDDLAEPERAVYQQEFRGESELTQGSAHRLHVRRQDTHLIDGRGGGSGNAVGYRVSDDLLV